MNLGKTAFSQLMSLLPDYEFNKCVARYNGDYRIKEFTCKEHFLVMSFALLTYRDSLRDIESCLQAMSKKLYRSGIKKPVARNTLAKTNERRNWRIYADFAQVLIAETRELYAYENTLLNDINRTEYALDSTTLTFVCRCFLGQNSVKIKALLRCIRYLTCKVLFPPLLKSHPALFMTLTYWIKYQLKQVSFT